MVHILGQFFLQYGYALAFPVMVVEGPLSTMLMAALASHGYFNVVIVFFLSFTADMISDYGFYIIGRRGAVNVIRKLSKLFRYDPARISAMPLLFKKYGGLAVFLAKLLPGLVPPIFISAGMAKYSRVKLFLYAAPAGLIWSGILCTIGYYFGHKITTVQHLLSRTGIILAIVVVLLILYQLFIGKKVSKKAIESAEEEAYD